jgi:hypothetical protein
MIVVLLLVFYSIALTSCKTDYRIRSDSIPVL